MKHERTPLAAFAKPNFRRFWFGQVGSNVGTWFQNLALSLVVLKATGSAEALAWVTVAQFTPLLILGPYAGATADRRSPRTILIFCSAASAAVAGALALVVASDGPPLISIFGLVGLGGCIQAFERAAGQAFVFELVGPRLLSNAVSLFTVAVSTARSIGPAVAGVAFGVLGPAPCLLVNAGSYVMILVALLAIRTSSLHTRTQRRDRPEASLIRRQMRDDCGLRSLLLVAVVVSVTAMSFMVTVTSLVSLTFGGSAEAVGIAHGLNAVGAIVGGLLASSARKIRPSSLAPACGLLAGVLALSGVAPSLTFFFASAPLLGLGLGLYQGVLYSAAQSRAQPESLGKIMSLFTMATFGFSPVGAAVAGALIDVGSSRAPFFVGSAACILCAVYVVALKRTGREEDAVGSHTGGKMRIGRRGRSGVL
jgi:MFS family permease